MNEYKKRLLPALQTVLRRVLRRPVCKTLMMLDVKVLVLCCCFVLVCKETQAKPFLRNTFQTLASSLFSSSSSSSDNIEDLRQQKPEKIRELSKYQDDVQEEPLEETFGGDANGQNEATPNIFQKKISKILGKLQVIAEIGRQFLPVSKDNEGEPKDSDFEFDFDEEFDGNDNSTQPNELETEAKKGATLMSEKVKFFSPSDFGVYVMEFVGSIVGLIYGAAIQLVGTRTNQ